MHVFLASGKSQAGAERPGPGASVDSSAVVPVPSGGIRASAGNCAITSCPQYHSVHVIHIEFRFITRPRICLGPPYIYHDCVGSVSARLRVLRIRMVA